MKHLTADELVDLAEGTRAAASAPHLQACTACRQQLGDLRATMTAIGGGEVPEPSPLFWDHFSARVRDAVAAEGLPPRSTWWDRFAWRGLAVPLSIAAFAAIILAVAVLVDPGRPAVAVPVPAAPDAAIAAEATEGLTIVPPDDPALDLVADLGSDLDWDAVHDSGMITHTGLIDRAVGGLSADERAELGKLLKRELQGGGN